MSIAGFQYFEKFEAGNLGHDDVANDDIRVLPLSYSGGFRTVFCLEYFEAPILQNDRERGSYAGIVVDDQYFSFSGCHMISIHTVLLRFMVSSILLLAVAEPASALPIFARRYETSCTSCH